MDGSTQQAELEAAVVAAEPADVATAERTRLRVAGAKRGAHRQAAFDAGGGGGVSAGAGSEAALQVAAATSAAAAIVLAEHALR